MKQFFLISILLFFFSAKIFAQPANDDPCGAITIPVNAGDIFGAICTPTTSYSWTAATLTAATPNPSCIASSQSNIRDVWYKMVVPASGKIQIVMKATLGHHLTVYAQATCSNTIAFVEKACYTYAGASTVANTTFTGLAAGTTVYLRITRTTEMPNSSSAILLCANDVVTVPVIDNTKSVGIGTNTPAAKLDVAGTTVIRDSLVVSGSIETRSKLKAPDLKGTLTDVGSVYSSPWLTSPYNSRDTTIDGTCVRVRHLDAPELTSTILNTKLISVYFRVGSIGPYIMPYISDAGGATNQINCILNQGIILIYRHTYNTCRFNSGIAESFPGQPVMINLPQSLEYRYVIHN